MSGEPSSVPPPGMEDFDPEKFFAEGVDYVQADQITGAISYLQSLDWNEPWLYILIAAHVSLTVGIVFTRRISALQSFLFVFMLMIVYVAEDLNGYLAKNHKMFTKHQYFDSPGLFISIVVSMPLLLDCCIIVGNWFLVSTALMREMKLKQDSIRERRLAKEGEKKKEEEKEEEQEEEQSERYALRSRKKKRD